MTDEEKEKEKEFRRQAVERARKHLGQCPCECNRGGFCGGCGHAGCGGRRR